MTKVPLSVAKFLFVASLIMCGNNLVYAQGQVSKSNEVTAAKTGVNCTVNTCRPGGCASCVVLTVYLPVGAHVDSVLCLTNAGFPKDYQHHDLHEVKCGEDVSWSIFDQAVTTTTQNNVVVTTTYHNRSSDRDRDVQTVVNWH
jgi:hypothetical protein